MSAKPIFAPRSGLGGEVTRARSLRTWGPAVWLSVVLFLVYTGIETTAGQWAYTLFVEGRGITVQAASLAVSVYWGALALGRVLTGVIADRVSPGDADALEHGWHAGGRGADLAEPGPG